MGGPTRQAVRFTANARFKVLPGGKLRLPKIVSRCDTYGRAGGGW
jgi:hypothetical protein